MRKLFTTILLASGLRALALPSAYFPAESQLATGRWVKVTTGEPGIYELSYDELRSMGFDTPEKVNVYGHGGRMMSPQFANASGNVLNSGSLEQVAVRHENGKLLFYAQGVDEIFYGTGGGTPCFSHGNRNIYSLTGSYLLSQQGQPKEVATASVEKDAAVTTNSVLRYVLHEEDLIHGPAKSGQLFWEHVFTPTQPSRSWTLTLPEAVAGQAMLNLGLYTSNDGYAAQVSASVRGSGIETTEQFCPSSSVYYTNIFPQPVATKISGPQTIVDVKTNGLKSGMQANLDWILLSYESTIPTGTNQLHDVVVGAGKASGTYRFACPSGYASTVVWDIMEPGNPVAATVEDGNVYLKTRTGGSRVVMFDASQRGRKVLKWEAVENCDLFSITSQEPQMLVITTTPLYKKALELAAMHSYTDGVKVAVVKTDDLYNTFSGGTPDIMAYRSMVKMLRMRLGAKFENVLLFGPLTADLRGISRGEAFNASDVLIAYQSPYTSIAGDTHNINDFICCTADVLPASPDNYQIDLGIGLLPVSSEIDASNIISKLERYLTQTDHARIANRVIGASGSGDQYLHTNQMSDLIKRWNDYTLNRNIVTPLIFDAYPDSQRPHAIADGLKQGALLWMYMGHSSAVSLTNNKSFSKAHLPMLDNQDLAFMIFGSCDVTNPDHGIRGLGESLVLDTPYGAVGSLLTTRTAWSSHNETMLRNFMQSMVFESGTSRRVDNLSIGRAFSVAKTNMRSQHEHTFQLIGDPSVKISVPMYTAQIEKMEKGVAAGHILNVEGTVINPKGEEVTDYNGEALVSIMAPPVHIACRNYITTNGKEGNPMMVKYDNNVLSSQRTEVADGKFRTQVLVPADASLKTGDELTVKICTYNPQTRIVASNSQTVKIVNTNELTAEQRVADTEAPSVDRLEYSNGCLEIELSDAVSVALENSFLTEGSELIVDGNPVSRLEAYASWLSYEPTRVLLKVPLKLAAGNHSARIRAADYSGNIREQDINFSAGERTFYSLSGQRMQRHHATFKVEGAGNDTSGHLVITDVDGKTVKRVAFNGTQVSADISDLGVGVYRAAVISSGPDRGHSSPFSFGVITSEK